MGYKDNYVHPKLNNIKNKSCVGILLMYNIFLINYRNC